jgi:CRP-like cAMP-binding protein
MEKVSFDLVAQSILNFGKFSVQELSAITNRLAAINVKKNTCVVSEGHICQEFYFINHGNFRHYEILENGTEATLNLYTEGDWMLEYKSMMTQAPSQAFIQATTDSEVFKLGAWDFHELVKTSDSFFRVGRIFEQAIQNQDYQNTRMTPEEKYALLLVSKPQIIQRFPLKYIASYLGISPETLSRVRRKLIS